MESYLQEMEANVDEPLSNLPPISAGLFRRQDAVVEVSEAEFGGEDDGVVGAERETGLEDDALEVIGIVGSRH